MFKQISHNPEPSVIGVNNGVYQIEIDEKYLKKNDNYSQIQEVLMQIDVFKFLKFQYKIFDLKIQHLKGKILKKAKITDIMGYSPFLLGFHYIVSQKFVDCLNEIEVSKKEYHLLKIDIGIADNNFYILHSPMIPTPEVIFENSVLFPEEDALLDDIDKRFVCPQILITL